jgi:hypothetical protein
MFKTPAWQRSEGQDKSGGLNAKGRASAKAEGHDLRPPAPNPKTETDKARKKSYCARAQGMKEKLTSSETANDPDSRINKSLRKWKCRGDGGALDVARQYKAGGGEIYLLKKRLSEIAEEGRKKKNLRTKTPSSTSPTTPYETSPTTPNISRDLYEKGNLGDDNYALAKGGTAKAASKVARRYRAFGGTDVPPATPVPPVNNAPVPPSAQSIPQANNLMMQPAYKQYADDINNAYKTYLGREGDAAGLRYWGEQIDAGNADLGNLRDTFLSSQEGKDYARTNPTQLVQSLYKQSLGRQSDEAGANYWAQQLSQGMSPQDIYNAFAGTQEAENYNAINDIYRQNLGRDVDQEGLKYWSDMMSKGNIDPEALGQIVSGSQEAKNYDNTAFIKDEYAGLLGREPSQEELSKALADLSSGKVTQEDFDNNLSKSEASQLYQASNFEPYDVASLKGAAPPKQLRTALQYAKSVPKTSEELNNVFAPIEEKYGLAPGSMIGKMGLESTWGQNPRAYKTNANYKGPFQLSKDIIKKYNVKNPFDLKEAAEAAAQYERDNAKEFEQKVGRKPLPHEGYNMHQQGLTGYSTLAKNPGMKAVDALKTIMKSGKASGSIRQNMPPSLQGKVSYKDVTAQQFMDGWKVEFEKKLAGPDGKGQTPVVASDKGTTQKEDNSYLNEPFQPGSPSTGDEISQQEFLQDQGIGGTMAPPGTTMFPITDTSGGGYQDPGQYGGNYTDVISGVTPPTVPHTVTHHPVTHTPVTHVGGGSHPSSGDHGSFGVGYAPDVGGSGVHHTSGADPYFGHQMDGYTYHPMPYGMSYYTNNSHVKNNATGFYEDPYTAYMNDQRNWKKGGRVNKDTGGAVKNAMDVARAYKKGGPVWDKPRPKSLGKPTPLSSDQKSSAKASAKAAGRPYPNLVDNMRAAKKS